MDCSALYTRRPDLLKRAFQHIPDYLIVTEGDGVANLMDYGISLGRRFRALKLWFVIRSFGVEGLRALVKEHIRIARDAAKEIDEDPQLERLAEVNFSTIVFRHHPPGLSGRELDDHNARILQQILASREVFISHTRVRGNYALRIAIGNIHTNESHVRRVLALVREAAKATV
jgi:aromatic-L-amino-acid decarboxylase